MYTDKAIIRKCRWIALAGNPEAYRERYLAALEAAQVFVKELSMSKPIILSSITPADNANGDCACVLALDTAKVSKDCDCNCDCACSDQLGRSTENYNPRAMIELYTDQNERVSWEQALQLALDRAKQDTA